MYRVNTQCVDERMITAHYYYWRERGVEERERDQTTLR